MNEIMSEEQLWMSSEANLALPFTLELENSEAPFECHEILTLTPGVYFSAVGYWQGKKSLGKFYYAPHPSRTEAQREMQGINGILNAQLLAPRLYYFGETRQHLTQALICELIFPAQRFEKVWALCHSEIEKTNLLISLLTVLAAQHKAGLYHQQFAIENFLLCEAGIVTVDCANIQVPVLSTPLGQKKSLKNLSELLACLQLFDVSMVEHALEAYAKMRGWEYSPSLVKKVMNHLDDERHKWRKNLKMQLEKIINLLHP